MPFLDFQGDGRGDERGLGGRGHRGIDGDRGSKVSQGKQCNGQGTIRLDCGAGGDVYRHLGDQRNDRHVGRGRGPLIKHQGSTPLTESLIAGQEQHKMISESLKKGWS